MPGLYPAVSEGSWSCLPFLPAKPACRNRSNTKSRRTSGLASRLKTQDLLPGRQLRRDRHRVRGTRRWQPRIRHVSARVAQPTVVRLGRAAGEEDPVYPLMRGEEGLEVVGHHAGSLDSGVQAADPAAVAQNIPDGE